VSKVSGHVRAQGDHTLGAVAVMGCSATGAGDLAACTLTGQPVLLLCWDIACVTCMFVSWLVVCLVSCVRYLVGV